MYIDSLLLFEKPVGGGGGGKETGYGHILSSKMQERSIHRGEKGRGRKKKSVSACPHSWSVHNNFARDGHSESITVDVSNQDF